MINPVGYGVFGTFGGPHGYQQAFYNGAQFRESLHLGHAIQVYPGTELYGVKRTLDGGVYTVCFCIYTSISSANNEDGTTFIGSCIVLQDSYAEAEYINNALREFHDGIINNAQNIYANILKAQHPRDIVTQEPPSFAALKANVIPINKTPFASTGVDFKKQYLVVADKYSTTTQADQVIAFFDHALKVHNDVGTLYFSSDNNVADFVREEAVIGTRAWSDFFNTRLGSSDLPAEPNRYVIASSEKIEPAELSKILAANSYPQQDDDNDPNKPFDLWEGPVPPNGWSREVAAARMKEYNRLFKYTNTLLEHLNEPTYRNNKRHTNEPEKIITTKMVFIFLGIMLMVGGTMYFNEEEDTPPSISQARVSSTAEEPEEDTSQAIYDTIEEVITQPTPAPYTPPATPIAATPAVEVEEEDDGLLQKTTTVDVSGTSTASANTKPLTQQDPPYLKAKDLHPLPNLVLTQNDITALRQQGVKNKTLLEIAKLLYENVPSNIGNIYKGQETEYAAALLNNNRQAFQQNGGVYIYATDGMMLHIPAYKSPLPTAGTK